MHWLHILCAAAAADRRAGEQVACRFHTCSKSSKGDHTCHMLMALDMADQRPLHAWSPLHDHMGLHL